MTFIGRRRCHDYRGLQIRIAEGACLWDVEEFHLLRRQGDIHVHTSFVR